MQDLDIKSDFSEADWIESESLRLLTQPRSRTTWIAAGTMGAMAIQLLGHVNVFLLTAWLLVSLVLLAFRVHVKSEFNKHLLTAYIQVRSAFIARNKLVWTLSGLTWGLSSWLFLSNIPISNQYIGATILTFVGLVAVHNLNTHREISTQFINLFMGTQVLGAFWYIAYVWKFERELPHYIHLLSLIVIWAVLHIFNNRMSKAFRGNLSLQYRNSSLIRTLNLKTEQLEHEKQIAVNANEVLQRFYASSAHDIRQPVYALKVYAELAEQDGASLPGLLPKITASCDAINRLFDSLFDFEQISAGHFTVSHHTVDIDEVIDDLEHQFKPLARHKNLEFRTNIVSGYLQTDQLLLKRILTCFISNAIKYTEKGGILITVRKRKSMIVFEIWDTGIGIDKEHLEHVFDEFFKVGDTTSTDEGFGLGLSVVKRLSNYAEGSTISVNSKIGVGSVFRFALPLRIYSPPYIKSRFENLKSLPLVLDHEIF